MLARVGEVVADLQTTPPPLPADEIAEAIQFLQWLAADNFTLLGARDYAYAGEEQALTPKLRNRARTLAIARHAAAAAVAISS